MKFFKNLKKNNKGFSLVELIIVIAIMAVLVGTLAPQYIRYVEKSRMAADATTIDNFVSVLEVIAATPDNGLNTTKEYTVVNSNGVLAPAAGSDLAGLTLYTELVDTGRTYELKSSAYKGSVSNIKLAYNGTKKIWEVSINGTDVPKTVE